MLKFGKKDLEVEVSLAILGSYVPEKFGFANSKTDVLDLNL